MDIILYDRQIEIMQVLWERGSATVAEVREAVADDMAYTTVLTMLRRLEEKGYVSREEEGRAHRYFPTVQPDEARDSALRRLTRGLFQGSPELVLTHLLAREKLSTAQLRRLKELVNDELGKEDP
jgi:BlaI family penicillinase repressor